MKIKWLFTSLLIILMCAVAGRMIHHGSPYFDFTNAFACQLSLILLLATVFIHRLEKFLLIRWIAFVLLYTLVPLTQLLAGDRVHSHAFMASFFFGNFIFCFITNLVYLIRLVKKDTFRKILLIIPGILWFVSLIYPMMFYGYSAVEHAVFDQPIVSAIIHTNPIEVVSYLSSNYSATQLVIYISGIAVFLVLMGYLAAKMNSAGQKRELSAGQLVPALAVALCCSAILSVSTVQLSNKGFDCLPRQIISYANYVANSFTEFRDSRVRLLESSVITLEHQDRKPSLYVLVIGESASSRYLQSYGYSQPTDPLTSKLLQETALKESELNSPKSLSTVNFLHAYSSYPQTIESLSLSLSGASQYNQKVLNEMLTIIDVAKKAGFETFWIGNKQSESIGFTPPVTRIAQTADHSLFIPDVYIPKYQKYPFDGEIMNNLPEPDQNRNTLVIINIKGSHTKYFERYPEKFDVFHDDPDPVINEYKNSLLYSDFVLDQLLNHFKSLPNFRAFVYFSDHGAEPAFRGDDHNVSKFTFTMVAIPFWAALSDSYITENRGVAEALLKNSEKCFTNDLIYDFMLGLMGIRVEGANDESVDLTSASYAVDRKNCLTLYGKKKIDEDPNY